MLKNKQIKFAQQSNNEIKQFIKINLNLKLISSSIGGLVVVSSAIAIIIKY